MSYMKRYSLYLLTLNSFCLFSMVPYENSSLLTATNTNNTNILPENNLSTNRRNNDGKKDFYNELQQCELGKIDVNAIHNKIDENHLDVNKNTWFKRIVGSYRSFCRSSFLTDQQVTERMELIESYIPEHSRELVLEQLEKQHWYVNYLLQASLQAKVKEIERVKGSNIDILYDPTITQEGFKRMVHIRALQKYFDDSDIKEDLFNGVPMGRLGNIHWTVLYGHKNNIEKTSITMSSDGKHLQSKSIDETEIILWDVEQGIKTNLSLQDFNDEAWIKTQHVIRGQGRYTITDKADNYCAEVFTPLIRTGNNGQASSLEEQYSPANIPVKIEKNEPAIIVFKRPSEASYLCQEAYYNSLRDSNAVLELEALRNSKMCATIEGYPKNNLEQKIVERINQLSSTSKL